MPATRFDQQITPDSAILLHLCMQGQLGRAPVPRVENDGTG